MKTIVEMAQEAGFEARRGWWVRDQVPEDIFAASVNITRELKAFAELVRAEQREKCAKVIDGLHPGLSTKRVAEIIRANNNT